MPADVSLDGVSLGGTLGLADTSLRGASLSETLQLTDALLRGVSLGSTLLLANASHSAWSGDQSRDSCYLPRAELAACGL